MEKTKNFILKNKIELIILLFAFLFSWWLMFSTFSYSDGEMKIASKAWSDFASHIPLIRSFSLGDNFPPQYPLFSGPPIKYHFLFYAFVGILEKIGFRLDYALNLPSIFGLTFLILMIYLFAKEIFKSRAVGVLSILFFIFNGSLEFLKFFSKHPISIDTFYQIINNQNYVSFGPYDGSIISAFWNLNIYTNQRHLSLSYALSLFLIYVILRLKEKNENSVLKKSFIIGIFLGISFIINMAVFLITVLVLIFIFLFFKKRRLLTLMVLIIAILIALPQYLYMQSGVSIFKLGFHPGYLVTNLNLINFFTYWIQNLGFHFLLIPLGFIFAGKNSRKILISFFTLFIIGNLFQFSPEIAANHKFFNFFMLIGTMFSAYFLVLLWNKKIIFKPFVIIIFLFLILSGILDFFPIYNDNKVALPDYTVNKDIRWIMKNTSPDSVFLNVQYLYDKASLTGRKIFLGWPYFAWSQGYDTNSRDVLRKKLLTTNDLTFFCDNALKYKLDYIEISPSLDGIMVNRDFFQKYFIISYKNKASSYYIYDINKTCK